MADNYRRPADLPEYEKPAVNETVMGVDFARLPGWNVTHYGLLHQSFEKQYPNVQAQPPLPQQAEDFGAEMKPLKSPFEFTVSGEAMDTRCWFIDRTDTQLLQVQADRFLRNWRQRASAEYPRYKKVRGDFADDWGRYLSFLRSHRLGEPEVRQCELTYINLIDATRLGDVLAYWREPEGKVFLPGPERGTVTLAFRVPNEQTRFHVAVQPVIRLADGKGILQMTLTVRGKPRGSAEKDLLDWFDLAHQWAVRGFDELTTEKMHLEWGRRS
jgi:uncharacterized protein (TIGR04255 family)